MAYNDGPTRKAPRLYISDPEGIKLVDFGASLNTVTGYVEQDGRIRHFVTNVTSGGPAEQFGMKSGDEIMLLNDFPLIGKSEVEVAEMFREEKVGVGFSTVFQRPADTPGRERTFVCCQSAGIVEPGGDRQKVSHLRFHQQTVVFDHWITLPPVDVFILHTEQLRYFHVSNSDHRLSARPEHDFRHTNSKFAFQKIVKFNLRGDVLAFFRHNDSRGKAFFTRSDGSHVNMTRVAHDHLLGDVPRDDDPAFLIRLHGLSSSLRMFAFEVEQNPGNYVTLSADEVIIEPSAIPAGDNLNLHFQMHELSFMTKDGKPSYPAAPLRSLRPTGPTTVHSSPTGPTASPSIPVSPSAAPVTSYTFQCCPCLGSKTQE